MTQTAPAPAAACGGLRFLSTLGAGRSQTWGALIPVAAAVPPSLPAAPAGPPAG